MTFYSSLSCSRSYFDLDASFQIGRGAEILRCSVSLTTLEECSCDCSARSGGMTFDEIGESDRRVYVDPY